jgi:hypothetical protein
LSCEYGVYYGGRAGSTSGLAALAAKGLWLKWQENHQWTEIQGGQMKLESMEVSTVTSEISTPRIVLEAEWLVARKDLLTCEKELTRLCDEVSRHRRELPWVKIEKEYVFEGVTGKETLSDLVPKELD